MKLNYLLLILVGLPWMGCKKNPSKSVDEDLKSLKDFYSHYEKTMTLGIPDSTASLYSKDGATLITPERTIEKLSQSQIINAYKAIPKMEVFQWEDLDYKILNDYYAYVVGSCRFVLQQSQNDTLSFVYTAVLGKEKKQWKILHENESPDQKTINKKITTLPSNP